MLTSSIQNNLGSPFRHNQVFISSIPLPYFQKLVSTLQLLFPCLLNSLRPDIMDSAPSEVDASSTDKAASPLPEIIKTPCPYEEGMPMNLAITRTSSDEIQTDHLTATITKVHSMTMSPVVEIAFATTSGATKKAVLKAFDRRFGQSFRHVRGIPGMSPDLERYLSHTNAVEKIWRDYVRDDKAKTLFEEIKALNERDDILPPCPEEFLEGMAPEFIARYEGALQYQALRFFDLETEAYARLSDLQGQGIPKLLAHVRICVEPYSGLELEETDTDSAKFFHINGIIMDRIDGFRLADLASSPLPTDKWEGTLQRTIDIATKINMKGVILGDCRPGNVLVETLSGMPFIHDFAQSHTWDTNDEDFGFVVCENQNPRRVVSSLVNRLQKEKEIELNLVYPVLHELVGLTKEEAEECWQIVF